MRPLFEAVLKNVPAPDTDVDAPLQLQFSALDYCHLAVGVTHGPARLVKPGQDGW